MDVPGLLSLLQVRVVDAELAGQDVVHNNLVLAFDEGLHGDFDEGKGTDALLLIFKLLLEVLGEGRLCNLLPLIDWEVAVVVEGLTVELLLDLPALVISESWELGEWVLVYPSTLHQVLRELDQVDDVLGGDPLGRSTNLECLSEHHSLLEHNIQE